MTELEPVAWRWAWKTTGSELEQRFADPDLYEWTYRDTPPSEGAAPKMDIEPLVTLSSAQSAIAERDARIAELERERDAFRGVLEGAEYGDIESIAQYDANKARALGRMVGDLSKGIRIQLDAAEALLKETGTEIERVMLFGGRMANACYNISRKLDVSSLDKRDLHFAQLEWDAETKAARSLASKIGGWDATS